ncbi:histidine phosphotransferase family protein [Paracoccus nototheniae]|uniref:Histidine phosphotransferase family protein n=1 Tax=Paracoccus nototheniae TaxID=2489002 RepID=A0ABW4DUX4_9RHOB|nr:histidine phosphotransferase family protein [Paracoccus nototheniae]
MTADTTRADTTRAGPGMAQIPPGDLTGLLAARLCHDLVSPLGAIGNGVELLEMSADFPGLSKSPEMRLIAEAVAAARSRIQGYRMAFGSATGDQRVGRSDLARLLDGVATHGRLQITLSAEGDFPRTEVRMVLLALMCVETALPWGGRVTIQHQAPGWAVAATFDRCRHDPDLWGWLDGCPARNPAPAEVHFALLAEAAMARNRPLQHQITGTEIRIGF